MYRCFFKRLFDFILSLFALVILSPVFLVLIVLGAIKMKGNPFFTQVRLGKKDKFGNECAFKLIKFRTMTNAKDEDGNLLPDEVRLNKYGKMLRSTSLDELPELINILIGNMSIVGPRPLLVEYLPWYTAEERQRHDVRPGLTGLAQVSGRNYVKWEEKFKMDIEYVNNESFFYDISLILKTVTIVFERSNIETASQIVHDGVVYMPLHIERQMKAKAESEAGIK